MEVGDILVVVAAATIFLIMALSCKPSEIMIHHTELDILQLFGLIILFVIPLFLLRRIPSR